jgi:light-regulated signal transduction histidine kinase (bacteriophytochrome)
VKVLRIAQNLVLNALKVTERGGIRVIWEERADSAGRQWVLCVQDTGPGFQPQSPSAPLERALRHATAEAHEVDARAGSHNKASAAAGGGACASTEPAATLKSQSDPNASTLPAGEGIGLSIVKRLCELLDASLELETAPGKGTTFRVLLPRVYQDGGHGKASSPSTIAPPPAPSAA